MSSVMDYITSQNSKVQILKKSIIVQGCIKRTWFESQFSCLFACLLANELDNFYKNEDPLECHLLTLGLSDDDVMTGAHLQATMKMMSLNIMLPPVIVKNSNTRNSIGQPIYIPMEQPEVRKSVPDIIACIGKIDNYGKLCILTMADINLNLTTINCELVNKEGVIQERFNIIIQEKSEE